jgi:hypothetical protein
MGTLEIYDPKSRLTPDRNLGTPCSVFLLASSVAHTVEQICKIACHAGYANESLDYKCSAVSAPLPFDICPALANPQVVAGSDDEPQKSKRRRAPVRTRAMIKAEIAHAHEQA